MYSLLQTRLKEAEIAEAARWFEVQQRGLGHEFLRTLRATTGVLRRTPLHYLLLSGFLVHRLTGRFVDSVASQVGYIPFDYRRFRWAKAGDWRWKACWPRRIESPMVTGNRCEAPRIRSRRASTSESG